MSHYGPPSGAGYPGPKFNAAQPAPRRALPILSIVGVTFAAMIVGGLIGGDTLLTLLSPTGGWAALGRGLMISALAFASWVAIIVGLVRHRSQRAVYRAPECLIGNGVLALIALWCVFHMATVDLKRPTRTNTVSASSSANTGPPNSTNDATSPASSATTASPSLGSLPPTMVDAHEIPDTNGRVPIDPCEWRLDERYLAASPGTPFQPIRGNSRLAIEFGHTANSYEVGVIDLTSDKRQPAVAIRPFAAEAPGIGDEGSANRSPFVVAASPEGRHVAIVDRSTRDAPAEVWRIAAPVSRVAQFPAWDGKNINRFVFVPDDTVAVFAKSQDELEWWSLTEGRAVATRPNGVVVPTPGHRFLAVGRGNKIGFYDSTKGTHVATLSIGGGQLLRIKGLGFRADCQRLIAYGDGLNGQTTWLQSWTLHGDQTERSQADCLIPLPAPHRDAAEARWLDADLVLVGPYVFSASQRQIVGQFDKVSTMLGPVGGRTLLRTDILDDSVWYPFPTSAVGGGGDVSALAARAPVIVQPGEPLQLSVDFSGANPDAKQREEITRRLRENLLAAGHAVQPAATKVVRVTVSDVSEPGTVVFHYVRLRQEPVVGDRELATGKSVTIPRRSLHCDAAIDDGAGTPLWSSSLSVGLNDVRGLVDVGLFSSGHDEVYRARWPVFIGRLGMVKPPAALVDYRQLTHFEWPRHTPAADWLAKRQTQVIASRLRDREASKRPVDLPLSSHRPWNVPRRNAAIADGAPMSPDRGLTVIWRDQTVRVGRASDGQELGLCESPLWNVRIVAHYELVWSAFHRSEDKLAVALAARNSRAGLLAAWDLTDGRLLGAFLYPKVGTAGRWVSSTELLADNQLVDVALETTVWRYAGGVPSDTASVPSDDVRAAIDAGKSKRPAWVATVDALALRVVAAQDLPMREAFTRRVTEQLERWAHEAGVRIDPASPQVLRVDLTSSIDNELTYRIRGNGLEWMVPKRQFGLNWRFESAPVPNAPSDTHLVDLTQIEYQLDPAAVDPDEDVSLAMQNALLADFAQRSLFSRYGYLHPGFGSSEMSASGERVFPQR